MSLIGEYPSLDGYKTDIKEMPIFKLREDRERERTTDEAGDGILGEMPLM
jgi:hypothetical protein